MNTKGYNTSTTRQCFKCKEIKPLSSEFFHQNKNRPLGFEYKCKVCARNRKDRRIKRYSQMSTEQKIKKVLLGKIYGKTLKGKAIHLLNAYRKIDLKKGMYTNLTQEYLINEVIGKPCTYCGFPSTGCDRINNSLGHIITNCVASCKECNVGRMDNFTHEEMFLLGATIRSIKLKRLT